jgi:hypothetical protein
MAGRGPAPKPASTRTRRNKQPAEQVIEVFAGDQPDLPDLMPMLDPTDGESFGVQWPAATVKWWHMWADHPISKTFTDSDWSFLLDTALIHGAYWTGDLKLGAELRQRVAKFGATPEDRARLRISFAVATKSEREAEKGKPPAKKTTGKKGKPADPRHLLTVVQGEGA